MGIFRSLFGGCKKAKDSADVMSKVKAKRDGEFEPKTKSPFSPANAIRKTWSDIGGEIKQEVNIIENFMEKRHLTIADIDCLFFSRSFLQAYDRIPPNEQNAFFENLLDDDLNRYLKEGKKPQKMFKKMKDRRK